MADSEILESTSAVIDALGGTSAVARLTERQPTAVSNWRGTTFPSNTYVVMQAALGRRGKAAPDRLWGMVPAQEGENRRHLNSPAVERPQ